MKACVTFLLLCWPLIATPAKAGEIRGTVTDVTGAVLPRVTLEARRIPPGGSTASVAVTAEDGRYVLSGMAGGITRAGEVLESVPGSQGQRRVERYR
jgi:hypothetical protein